MTSYFDDIKTYVGFGSDDSAALAELLPRARAQFPRLARHFYECIERHPRAHAALSGPEQTARLVKTLQEWMESGLAGPHDEEFFERRCRIGRVHVRIALPQQYMFTAMNVMRLDFREVVDRLYTDDIVRGRVVNAAIDKLFDLELAIMLETYRQDSEAHLRRTERFATVGQLASNIAHDLRNPLGVIESSLYIVRRRPIEDPRLERHLDKIAHQVDICGGIITNLLELARSRPPRREPVDVQAVISRALSSMVVPEGIEIERHVQPKLELYADPGLLERVLGNLIGNAIHAHEGREGTVFVRVEAEGDHVAIEVADDGPGFDPQVIARVFEPLVTTRATGIGLGLAMVKNIVERHGGTIEATNRPEGGARVRLRLPGAPSQEQGNG